MPGLAASAFTQPRQALANAIHCFPDTPRLGLHEVNIFRVAKGPLEQQLIDCSAAAKGDLSGQCWRVEEIAKRAADN
jgi:hypothetical protein